MRDLPIVLLVEDEKAIVRFLKASLAGLDYRLAIAATGQQAQAAIEALPPDVIILDLGLPDIDGREIIDSVRRWSQIPIIILSARDQEADKVDALDRGADDYLTKPFSVAELLARLRVALRHRAHGMVDSEGSGVFRDGDLEVDLIGRAVRVAEKDVLLTPIEYRLLTLLIANAGKVLTHRMIMKEIWGPGYAGAPHTVRVHMANLRRKIEAIPERPTHILTEQGVGYRFIVRLEN